MKSIYKVIVKFSLTYLLGVLLFFTSCKLADKLNQDPEIEPLKLGFKVSAALGYSASLAHSLFNGQPLPENVIYESTSSSSSSGAGIMYVTINSEYPLPFNRNIGQLIIACVWNKTNNNGVITVIFSDYDVLAGKYNFKGIHTVPVSKNLDGELFTVFAEQDVVIGEGVDTLISLSFSNPQINLEQDRLDAPQAGDAFAFVKQNVWFINIDQNNTPSNIYDDEFTINGGGQIVGVTSDTGGILYHALIGVKFTYNQCNLNPTDGIGFIQNLQAGSSNIDLGNIFLEFHEQCDGKANVTFATGKYVTTNGRNVNLNFN